MSISPLGRRYLAGELRQHQLRGEFRLSRPGDIPVLGELSPDELAQLVALGESRVAGRVAFGVLAAGASSRMDLQDVPPLVLELLKASGRETPPASKALVPAVARGEVLTFLDLFLRDLDDFRQRHGVDNPAVLLASEANVEELAAHLAGREDVWRFVQPLVPSLGARREELRPARGNFPSVADFEQAWEQAERLAGHDLPLRKPAGHGEFLHQLVVSGMLGRLLAAGIECLTIRNIDNAAARLDEQWLALYGYFERERMDCLLEVCPRLPGQKGGALIEQSGEWRIAEDPSFQGTGHSATESHYINNAVAIMRVDYLLKLYRTTRDELWGASPERLAEIVDATRRRFPVIVEAKPARLPDGTVVGAVAPETNLWESTGVVEGAHVGAIAVPSEADLGPDFLDCDPDERRRRALRVRFSPIKTWSDFAQPTKRELLAQLAAQLMGDRE